MNTFTINNEFTTSHIVIDISKIIVTIVQTFTQKIKNYKFVLTNLILYDNIE